ncbi:MAG TPA: hypothetical protein VGB06_01500 [Solirubrobacterales bacterium]|jgi:hypothetical protein
MAQALDRLAAIRDKASASEVESPVAEIDAGEFRRARQDSKLRRFAKAADERLHKMRSAGRMDS